MNLFREVPNIESSHATIVLTGLNDVNDVTPCEQALSCLFKTALIN